MRLTRKGIENMHLRQLEHVQRQLDARESKTKSIMTRKNWLERQSNANYRNEYDRIQGELSHFRGPTTDKKKLQDRSATLQRLFSSGNV
jgi:hypothetical protein